MTNEQFWQLIEESRTAAAKGESQLGFLEKAIGGLTSTEIINFEGLCWDALSVAYRRDLWAVATIIQPSLTQLTFDAVRAWMILQGKEFFDSVVAAPQRLAEVAPRGRVPWFPDGEMLMRLVPRLYRRVAGEEMPTVPRKVPNVLKGARWTEQDLPTMYPELWKKYRS